MSATPPEFEFLKKNPGVEEPELALGGGSSVAINLPPA
jgi:hypothetical protein